MFKIYYLFKTIKSIIEIFIITNLIFKKNKVIMFYFPIKWLTLKSRPPERDSRFLALILSAAKKYTRDNFLQSGEKNHPFQVLSGKIP